MKSASIIILSALLCHLPTSVADEVQALVAIRGDLSFVRCNCPLDSNSNYYPTIVNEIGYCDLPRDGFLKCDDAVLSCATGLMQCWTPGDSWICPCPWSITTDGLVSVSSTESGGRVECSSSEGGEQTCDIDGTSGVSHLIGNDINAMVEYCNQILDDGRKCLSPFFVRHSNGTITEVNPYPSSKEDIADDNTANADSPESVPAEIATLLPRCENTDSSGGQDDWWISPVGSHCANFLYRSDFRLIGGGLLTYFTDVKDTESCESSYKLTSTTHGLGGDSGDCKSYYVSQGVACLSSCYHKYDCYVSQEEVALDIASCALAAFVEEPTSAPDKEEADAEDDGNVCYDYNYSKGSYREDPPGERKCTSPCVSCETALNDSAISVGGCASDIDNFHTEMDGNGDMRKCVECNGHLCNPVYSYNGSSAPTDAAEGNKPTPAPVDEGNPEDVTSSGTHTVGLIGGTFAAIAVMFFYAVY